ncbi:MAG: PEP-CTERM sorting domain-containing protein [Armatimonadetes bacterium]|nr:PEP-CTERM sorting domain-containing protein [Armatimonadota bacterium]
MNTRILVICLSLLAVSARASFELLLVADNGSNTFATRAIHRFDPATGAYLGKFGGFNLTIAATFLDQATNSLYVTAANGTTRWNYNTGEFLGSSTFATAAGQVAVRPGGDRAVFLNGLTDMLFTDYPTIGGGANLGFLAGASYSSAMWTSKTSLVAFETNQSRMVNLTTNLAGTTATVGTISTGGAASADSGQICANGGATQLIVAGGTGGNARIYVPGTTAVGTLNSVGGNVMSAASAHFGFFLGSNQGAAGRVDFYDNRFNLTRQFGQSVLVNPVSMQSVLAPEPGSMAGLGLGLVALLKRRKI